ncbi:MAG: PAS domain-containing protein [Geobacteraceae bacterium]|nr:PAS domain-containing protein [Geobacteraceae bacterium]
MNKDSSEKSPFQNQESSKGHLELSLDSLLDGFFACDAEWQFVYLNSAAESVLGIKRDDALGKNFWEFSPFSQDTTLVQEYMRAAAGEASVFDTFVEPSGRWFQHRCFPHKGGGICVLLQDITHNKLEVQKLLGNGEKYRALVESTNDCLWESDVQVE